MLFRSLLFFSSISIIYCVFSDRTVPKQLLGTAFSAVCSPFFHDFEARKQSRQQPFFRGGLHEKFSCHPYGGR